MTKKKEIIFALVALVIMIFALTVTTIVKNSAKTKNDQVQSEVMNIENNIKSSDFELKAKESKVLYEQSGISTSQVDKDTTIASNFFEPAFSWTSGKEYDSARNSYIAELGANNKFVKEYMRENTKVDDYNKIDTTGIKAKFDSIEMFPVKADDSIYSYVGIITYYVYQKDSDLNSLQKLKQSKAIVSFDVMGDKSRVIKNVSAWSGMTVDAE